MSRFLAFCKAVGATAALLMVVLAVLLTTGALVDRFSEAAGSVLALGMILLVAAFYVGISLWLGRQAGWRWGVLGVLCWPIAFPAYVYGQNRGKLSSTTGRPFAKFPTVASGGGLLAVSAALLVTALVIKDRGADAAVQADGARPTATASTISSRLTVTPTPEPAVMRSENPAAGESGGEPPKDVSTTTLKPNPTSRPTTSLTSEPPETPEPRPTPRPRPTSTATPEPTATERPRPTATSTPEPTATPKPTSTPEPTSTPRPTSTPEPTSTPRPTPTSEPPAARFDPDDLISVLLRAPFTDDERPGSDAPEVSVSDPTDPAALTEVQALGDLGMIAFTVYASDADAIEGASLDLGMAISSSTYPTYPMVVFPNNGDGASLASIVVGNVVVSGFTTEALIALSGFDNAESMAMVLAERGVAHLERVASRSPGRKDDSLRPSAGSKATITEPDINLRAAPATNADVVAVLDQGEKLRITGTAIEADGLVWWPVEVQATRQTGYVAEQFLSFEPGDR